MRLIHTNDQLYSLMPNIMAVVKGERPVIDKIVPFIDASEKRWSCERNSQLVDYKKRKHLNFLALIIISLLNNETTYLKTTNYADFCLLKSFEKSACGMVLASNNGLKAFHSKASLYLVDSLK